VDLSLAKGTALREELKGDETAVFPGRAAANLLGLVPGRDRNMYGHMLMCNRISNDAKAKLEVLYFSKNAFGAAPTLHATAAASANGRSMLLLGGLSPTCAPPQPSAKRHKSSKSSSIVEYGLFGERFKHHKDHHGLLIAEFLSVHTFPSHVICSPEFRELQDFYVASADRNLKSGLVVYPRKIMHEILPLRYIQAVALSRARIHASAMSDQLTLADDG
jgi:hypothetical protein